MVLLSFALLTIGLSVLFLADAAIGQDTNTCQQVVFSLDAAHEEDFLFGWTGGFWSGADSLLGDRQGFPEIYFRSNRWGSSFRYEIEGEFSADRKYQVTLGFAEIYQPNCDVGRRRFDVHVNGEVFVEELDVFEQVGCETALVLRKEFSPSADGKMVVTFSKGPDGVDNSMISLIEISECNQDNACPCWDAFKAEEIYSFSHTSNTEWSPQPSGLTFVTLRTLEGPKEFQKKHTYTLTHEYDGTITCNAERRVLSATDFAACKEQILAAGQRLMDLSYSGHVDSKCPDAEGEWSLFSSNVSGIQFSIGYNCGFSNYEGKYNPAAGIYYTGGFGVSLYSGWNEHGYYESYDFTHQNVGENQCHKDASELCLSKATEMLDKL